MALSLEPSFSVTVIVTVVPSMAVSEEKAMSPLPSPVRFFETVYSTGAEEDEEEDDEDDDDETSEDETSEEEALDDSEVAEEVDEEFPEAEV
jgi:hypothetical protein